MRKEYRLVDKSWGEYTVFKAIQHSVEDCHKVAREYNLDDYFIIERKVSPWTQVTDLKLTEN